MADAPPPAATPSAPPPAAPKKSWKADLRRALRDPLVLTVIALGLVVGTLGALAGWQYWLGPQKDVALRRFNTVKDVMALYGMQIQYKQAHGTFANDLETLLASSPDGAELKAAMADHLDMATIAVVGDAEHFKIEANVLDKERTLVKIRGPIEDRPARRAAPALPIATQADDTGAPISGPTAAPPAGR